MNHRLNRSLLIPGAAMVAFLCLAGGSHAGRIMKVVPEKNRVVIESENAVIKVYPVSDEIFRIETLPIGSDEKFSPSAAAVLSPDSADYQIVAGQENVTIQTPMTGVVINRETSLISFFDREGNPLLKEVRSLNNGSGMRKAMFDGIESDENLFGAGERGHSLRLNGDSLVMYNRQNYGYGEGDPRISQMNITMPYIVSDYGYGILFDDYSKSTLITGDTIRYESDSPDPVAYYFINGGDGSLAGATEQFTALTGRQPMPPLWALGYITSKYGYHTQHETEGAIDSLKTRGYPVDGIVLDLFWYGKETDMGRFDWNREQFPDPEGMLSRLKKQGVKTVTISQPYINKIGAIDNYNYLSSRGMIVKDSEGKTHDVTTWVGDAGMLDVSNPATREWMWKQYRRLANEGVEGFWGDLGEPEVHPSSIVHDNGLKAEQYHNLYGNEWSRILAEGLAEEFPDKRIMLLMRGGTAGLQRYGVFPWSTDVARSWEGLQPQIKIMLNSGLSGLGYMSSDIGGFAVDPKNPIDGELYVRWLQSGTFSPTLRTHAQFKPEPYHYPQYEKITKDFIRQRYTWLPYNYTLAYENASAGLLLVRPLNFRGDNPENRYAEITDEYLWGDEVLVAPVMKKGARSRKVVFPAGVWIDWNNPRLSYKGGSTAIVKAPLSVLPMFVKEGSFIPQYMENPSNTDEYDPSKLTIVYFPAQEKTSYQLYDDNRRSPDVLETGEYRLTTFTGKQEGKQILIGIRAEGGYPGMADVQKLTFRIERISANPSKVEIDGKEISRSEWKYSPSARTLTLPVNFTGEDVAINVKF